MPIFDYKCEKCFNLEENVLTDMGVSEYRCKTCGGFMIKQFPQSSFRLKGDGWAKDLYTKKASNTNAQTKSNDKKD